jgi:hypothetical protein
MFIEENGIWLCGSQRFRNCRQDAGATRTVVYRQKLEAVLFAMRCQGFELGIFHFKKARRKLEDSLCR